MQLQGLQVLCIPRLGAWELGEWEVASCLGGAAKVDAEDALVDTLMQCLDALFRASATPEKPGEAQPQTRQREIWCPSGFFAPCSSRWK